MVRSLQIVVSFLLSAVNTSAPMPGLEQWLGASIVTASIGLVTFEETVLKKIHKRKCDCGQTSCGGGGGQTISDAANAREIDLKAQAVQRKEKKKEQKKEPEQKEEA
jgi:hypothetical protein